MNVHANEIMIIGLTWLCLKKMVNLPKTRQFTIGYTDLLCQIDNLTIYSKSKKLIEKCME